MQAGSLTLTLTLALRQVDAKECTGATALHRAASTGRTDIIRLLLGAKAKIDARNQDKATPLLLAAIAGHQPAAILLAGKGADVEVGNGRSREFGWSPASCTLPWAGQCVLAYACWAGHAGILVVGRRALACPCRNAMWTRAFQRPTEPPSPRLYRPRTRKGRRRWALPLSTASCGRRWRPWPQGR